MEGEPWRRSRDIDRGLTPSQPRLLDLLRYDQLPSLPPLAEGTSVYRNHPVRMQFCQLLRQQHAAEELFLHTILWTGECFMRVGVFSVHNSHIWTRDNPRVVAIMWVSIPLQHQHFGWYRRGHYCWPYTSCLTGWLTAQWYHSLLETVLPMLSQICFKLLGRYRDFIATDLQHTMGKMSLCGWSWCIQEGGVDVEGRCTAFAVAGCSFDEVFLVGTLDGACSYNSSHDQDRMARPASCNNDRRQRIKSSSKVCFAAYCRRPWNGRRRLRTPTVGKRRLRFDRFIRHKKELFPNSYWSHSQLCGSAPFVKLQFIIVFWWHRCCHKWCTTVFCGLKTGGVVMNKCYTYR